MSEIAVEAAIPGLRLVGRMTYWRGDEAPNTGPERCTAAGSTQFGGFRQYRRWL